ncbi:AAA family ATPase [Nanoarchaeota archaeon]
MTNKTIGIISIKGGVGKTTVSANLAAALAKLGSRVLLVDANFTAPNTGLHLGIVKPELTVHDVLFDKVPAEQATINTEWGFDLLAGSLNPKKHQQKRINPYKLHNRLASLKVSYDYIVIDSSPNLNDEMLSTMIAADELYVVSSPDFPTLSCTLNAVNIAKERKTPISGIILNKVKNKSYELKPSDVEYATNVPVVSSINDHDSVLESLSKTIPAVRHTPKKCFAVEYFKLAASISGADYKDPRFLSKVKDLFKKT